MNSQEISVATFVDMSKAFDTVNHSILLEKLGSFARTATITTGRDGNLSALGMQIKSVGKTIHEFKSLEKTVLEELGELSGRNRGGKKLAYDQR